MKAPSQLLIYILIALTFAQAGYIVGAHHPVVPILEKISE